MTRTNRVNATHNPTECGVCQEDFDDGVRTPRTLLCGHHLCTTCIGKLILNNTKSCPFCREGFRANTETDIMINFGLMECIRYFRDLKPIINKLVKKSQTSYQQRISKVKEETSRINNEQLDELQHLTQEVEKHVIDVSQLQENLHRGNTDIKERVLPVVNGVVNGNYINIAKLKNTDKSLQEYLKELEAKIGKLSVIKNNLEDVGSFQEAASAMDNAEEVNNTIREWAEVFQEELSRKKTSLEITTKETAATQKKIKECLEILTGGHNAGREESSTPVVRESLTPVAMQSSTPVVRESLTPVAMQSSTPVVRLRPRYVSIQSSTPVVRQPPAAVAMQSTPAVRRRPLITKPVVKRPLIIKPVVRRKPNML